MASDWFARVEGDSGFCRGVARLPGRQGAWLSSGAWRRSVSCVSGISGILCRNNHRWLQQTARRGEFEEVVDGAEQRPFALHRDEAAPQELAEAACLLDLPRTPVRPPACAAGRGPRARRRPVLPPSPPPGCAVGRVARAVPRRRVCAGRWRYTRRCCGFRARPDHPRTIAGIGRDLRRSNCKIGRNLLDQRLQMRAIARLVADHLGNNNLRRGVDRGLRVETLDKAVLGLHDPALRIGEVALRRPDAGAGFARRRAGGSLPRLLGLSAAAACASASSAALASRFFAKRRSVFATQSGISSPRRSAPCRRSSTRSA